MNIPYVTTFAKQYHAERLLVHTQCGLYEVFDVRCIQYDEERDSTWIVAFVMVSVSDRTRWLTLRVHLAVPLEVTLPKYPGATFLHVPNQELVTLVDCKICAFRRDATVTDVLRAFGVMSKRSLASSPWMSESFVDKLVSLLRYTMQRAGLGASSRMPNQAVVECSRNGLHVIQTCGFTMERISLDNHHSNPSGGYNEVVNKP